MLNGALVSQLVLGGLGCSAQPGGEGKISDDVEETTQALDSRDPTDTWSSGPLVDRIVCLSELSKNLEGELRPVEAEREGCRERDCKTLETVHQLDLRVTSNDCDSGVGRRLDGELHTGHLVHKYQDGDGNRRGVHEGPFRWRSAGLAASGTLQGVTNLGTHRKPAFKGCQRCDDRGVMEGLLLGTITEAEDRHLIGCELRAAYRLRFDPSRDTGASGGVTGTLEGSIVCDCSPRPPPTCIELGALAPGAGPNPRVEQGVSFDVHDFTGAPAPDTRIGTMGSFTGLDVRFRTEVKLPVPYGAVEATLVTFAQPAELEAFNSDGTPAGAASMTGTQNVDEALRVTGTSIDRVIVTAKANETLLLRLCFEPLAR